MSVSFKITNYQQEILKSIPPDLTEEDIKAIRRLLAKYFLDRAGEEADKFWDEKGFKSAKDMEDYLNE